MTNFEKNYAGEIMTNFEKNYARKIMSVVNALKEDIKINVLEGIIKQGRYTYISLWDYSSFVPELSSNGGRYSYAEKLYLLENGKYELYYYTSADIGGWCNICGNWNSNCCDESDRIILSARKVAEFIINTAKQIDDGADFAINMYK